MKNSKETLSESKIIVLGGGDAGIGVALTHLSAGYKVDLYEASPATKADDRLSCLRRGASGMWIREHGGGEYPTDIQTALDLLHAAIVMHKIMPGVIYNKKRGVQYLITALAEREGIRTLDAQTKVMGALKKEYENLCKEDVSISEIFGKPEEFCTNLKSEAVQAAY